VRVWSPNAEHREAFVKRLVGLGFRAKASESPEDALEGSQVGSSITSASEPFLEERSLNGVEHLNVCGGNNPEHAEIAAGAVGAFDTIVVDDLPQARVEYGDLIQAARAGEFSWDNALELKDIVGGNHRPKGRTLFKSGGVALEDVAVASMIFDKASKSGRDFPNVELV
jgi:alanine dehydrogenase